MTLTPRQLRLRRTVRFVFWAPVTIAAFASIAWSLLTW